MPKAFVSYSTIDKVVGGQVKSLLEGHGMDCFLAHEDLEISDEWKLRILDELRVCHVLVVLLSKSFRESQWGPQEVGVVVGRGSVPIIPLSIDGTIPFGFISHIQSKLIPSTGPTEELVIAPIRRNLPHLVLPGMIQDVAKAGNFRWAEVVMKRLVPLFPALNQDELDALVAASIDNGQVWSAADCRVDYLPKLIAMHRSRIRPEQLRALEYQVEHDRWYSPEVASGAPTA
jgi:hypothetical protein